MLPELIRPDWAAPACIGAAMSTRRGGVSAAPFDSLNLRPSTLPGDALDDALAVAENQRRFAAALGAQPVYLDQVHGSVVHRLRAATGARDSAALPRAHDAAALPHVQAPAALSRADASVTTETGLACTVLVADCLPVLFCTDDGRAVAAAHAGWRGLAGGVLQNTVQALCAASGLAAEHVHAWLGPCIGPRQFEVGADVRAAFAADADCFTGRPRADGAPRWLADLPALACRRLAAAGVQRVSGGAWCTVEDAQRFFSYRRDGLTGRLAAAVWIEPRPRAAAAGAAARP